MYYFNNSKFKSTFDFITNLKEKEKKEKSKKNVIRQCIDLIKDKRIIEKKKNHKPFFIKSHFKLITQDILSVNDLFENEKELESINKTNLLFRKVNENENNEKRKYRNLYHFDNLLTCPNIYKNNNYYTIQPKTKITQDMIGHMEVAQAFVGNAAYYGDDSDIIGKYSNYNTMIAEGSLFYTDLLIEESKLPDSSFINVKDGYTVINYKVDMDSTYANSMMPNDLINIYFKANADDGSIMFGKFLSNVEILDVKDEEGRHVFENSEESRVPAYMLFSLPEEMHLLFRKAIYLSDQFGVQLILVPNTQELTEEDTVMVSSKDIQSFINSKTKMVSVDEILSKTDSVVKNSTTTTTATTATTNKNNTR